MERKNIVLTGIGTEIGKTFISAIVCEALKADYWKPIQAGELDSSDSMKVKSLLSNDESVIYKEGYCLQTPMSPHESAKRDGIQIDLSKLQIPETTKPLVIESAGGLMVPLNDSDLFIDFIKQNPVEVILVSRYYLGSINHTLLSLEILKSAGIPVIGIIFNGKKVQSTFDIIMNHTSAPCILEVDEEETITPEVVKKYADRYSK